MAHRVWRLFDSVLYDTRSTLDVPCTPLDRGCPEEYEHTADTNRLNSINRLLAADGTTLT